MMQLVRMDAQIKFDRPIDPKQHVITPGGYEFNGIQFDFDTHWGTVTNDPTVMEFEFADYDSLESARALSPEDLEGDCSEFFIYTGEHNDPEINAKEVLAIRFFFREEETSHEVVIEGDERLLKSINSNLDSFRE